MARKPSPKWVPGVAHPKYGSGSILTNCIKI